MGLEVFRQVRAQQYDRARMMISPLALTADLYDRSIRQQTDLSDHFYLHPILPDSPVLYCIYNIVLHPPPKRISNQPRFINSTYKSLLASSVDAQLQNFIMPNSTPTVDATDAFLDPAWKLPYEVIARLLDFVSEGDTRINTILSLMCVCNEWQAILERM